MPKETIEGGTKKHYKVIACNVMRYDRTYRQYVERYGEDKAQYLMDMEQDWLRKYTTAAYVDLGVGSTKTDEAYTRRCAEWLGWRFDRLEGDARLTVRLLNGEWDDREVLVVEPGQMIKASNQDDILRSVPAEPGPDAGRGR